jgi:hypothetical protein
MEKFVKHDSKWWRLLLLAGVVILMAFVLGACADAETPAPTDVPPSPAPPTATSPPPTPKPTDLPDQSAQVAAVAANSHNLYDVGHGPNTWCTRCHSPQNWDPEAFQGPPPDCFTCKFPHEEEMRVAPGNAFVPEEEWVGVPCETCHVIADTGVVTEGIAWFNPIKEEYQAVSNSTELCEKCHVTTTGNAFGSAVDHKITLGGSAHLNYGGFLGEVAPPTFCADCHDPHTLEPKQCVDCHEGIPASDTHMKGYNALMLDKVSCIGCHDASGADVGPPPDDPGGVWVTQLTTMGRGGPSTDVIVSHSIVYEVSCDRCHFDGNMHELTVLTADGEVPEPTPEGGAPPGPPGG